MLLNLDQFNRFQLIKLLDIYKYNSNFMNGQAQSGHLKLLLENQLETKQNQKLNESEEEELKILNTRETDDSPR